MITGKIKNGFEFEIDEELMDDYEFLEVLCEVDNGNAGKIPMVAEELLGKEQKKALMEHIRGENKRVSARKMGEAIGEILTSCGQGKNS